MCWKNWWLNWEFTYNILGNRHSFAKGRKYSTEVANADFQMDTHTFSFIRTWTGGGNRGSCLQNPICSQRLTSDTPLYISSSFPFFPPSIISICNEWLKMAYNSTFPRKQRAQPAAQLLWIGGKAGYAPCSKSVLSSTLRLDPKGH